MVLPRSFPRLMVFLLVLSLNCGDATISLGSEQQPQENRAMVNFASLIATTKATPRPYQERVVTKSRDYFGQGVKTCMINSPTGSGKTVMGLLSAAWMQKEDDSIGVAWSAMRRNLLTQAKAANDTMGIGVDSLTMISMFDKEPPTHDAKGRQIKLLIVDEAQHDAAASMSHLHNVIEPEYVLGLSATPYRTDRLKLCFEKVIKDAGIHQLIQQGFLSQYHQFTIPRWDVSTVVARYLAEQDRWGKSAMYWQRFDLAFECLNALRAAGVRAEIVFGAQSDAVREDILNRFESTVYGDGDKNGIDVIVNLFVLTEGWDCPSLKTAWVRDSQRGPTVQMAGRAFRQFADYPFKQIVQSVNTKWPIQRTATPQEQLIWMDECWRSVKASTLANEVQARALRTVAMNRVQMPDFIEKRKGKTRPMVAPVFLEE